jgi:tRNA 5-methylaminomethyl-2-thiouridine biosynthesis bifunctional protein
MLGAPRSKEFDDVYFSAENGLAETRHTFLAGNGLPERWVGRPEFVIGETGFGTGLNFLAVWKLFEETAAPDQSLHFISFEKFPLRAAQIGEYLQVWRDEFGELLETLVEKYQEGTTHINERVRLTLIFGDVNEEIRKLDTRVDAWFLDGFKPSGNPEMWSETVFANMARLSASGTTLATFTAAGFVRRGLKAAGFAVEKVRGYGTKRDMTVGVKCA